MLTHRQKQKLARKLSNKQSGHFDSSEWEIHKDNIARKMQQKQQKQQKQQQP